MDTVPPQRSFDPRLAGLLDGPPGGRVVVTDTWRKTAAFHGKTAEKRRDCPIFLEKTDENREFTGEDRGFEVGKMKILWGYTEDRTTIWELIWDM